MSGQLIQSGAKWHIPGVPGVPLYLVPGAYLPADWGDRQGDGTKWFDRVVVVQLA